MIRRGGDEVRRRGGVLFNRKLTEFAQNLHSLKVAVDTLRMQIEEEKSANRRYMLEFADLGEKMRRTYLRLSRIVKIDSETTSAPETAPEENGDPEVDARLTRERINSSLGL